MLVIPVKHKKNGGGKKELLHEINGADKPQLKQ